MPLRSLHVFTVIGFIAVYMALTGAHASQPEIKGAVFYNLKIHHGRMLPHNEMLSFLNRDQIRGIEINTWFGDLYAENTYNPRLGAGYFFSNMGNNVVLGNIHSLSLSVLYPMYAGRLPVEFKTNLGVGYATKRYDPTHNVQNRAIGSHLNFYGQLSLTGRVQLAGSRLAFRPGISFHHVSNGLMTAPNAGLNMLTFYAGADFRSAHRPPEKLRLKRQTCLERRHRFATFYAAGIKQIDIWTEERIFTSSLVFDYGFRLTPSVSIGAGIGFFYNETWAYVSPNEKIDSLFPFQSAIHLSLQKDVGPLAFFVHPGTYIYLPADEEIPFFTGRLGLRYKFANNLTLQFGIKHWWFALADYFEWAIGYEFYK